MPFIFLVLLIISAVSPAYAAAQNYALDTVESHIEFDGDSTLHSFHGISRQVLAEDISFDSATGGFESPRKVKIPVAGLDTFNNRRDVNLRKMFEQTAFTDILWESFKTDCKVSGVHEWKCDQEGALSIHGIQRAYTLHFSVAESGDDELSADGDLTVSLRDFKLKPPSVLGLVKVSDLVKVRLKTRWKPK